LTYHQPTCGFFIVLILAPDLRRTWLFGAGADSKAHQDMLASEADALIVDLEDFTPSHLRATAREMLANFVQGCRTRRHVAAIRINALETDGTLDLAAAMRAQPDIIAYPMADRPAQMYALNAAITHWEEFLGFAVNSTEILPVCETALGLVEVRAIVASSSRIRCALLGAEDLANDLCAERGPDGVELEYARRRFVLECRAARVEPIDAPYTFGDIEGAERETRFSRRLGYRSKSLVLPEHARTLNSVLTPNATDLGFAQRVIDSFDSARARGEDRAFVDGLWVELPTYRNARKLIERARRLNDAKSE
jgi:citrate lyase subunit beta / citryl-CoA lyase